eukprot:superscaffoldBa00001098_g8950
MLGTCVALSDNRNRTSFGGNEAGIWLSLPSLPGNGVLGSVFLLPSPQSDRRGRLVSLRHIGSEGFLGLCTLEFRRPRAPAWWVDTEVVYRNRDGHVIKFNFALNETELILSNSTFVAFKVAKYSLSADLKYALFAYDVKQIYIFENNIYYQSDVRSNSLRITSSGMEGVIFNGLADWLYEDVRSNSLRITSSGMEGVIFNGLADWLYEEEILRSHLAHWWSPDGEKLAFLTINDTLVPNMALPQFTGSTYPRGLQYPYPMGFCIFKRDFYVPMVKWISNTHLAVRWLNRAQNASLLTVCDATVGVCHQRHEDSSEAWLPRQRQEPLFSKDRSRFFLTLPVKQGGQGDFQHITMFTKKLRSDQDEVRHLTSGDWEVTKIVAYDENNQIIVSALGLFPRRCLTCGLKEECTFFDANVSPDAQQAVLHCKELPLKLIYPPDFSESYLYGLLLIVGSSPGGQAVTEEFRLDWDWVLVGLEQVIVARLDGRGSGFRGERVLQQVHQRLGTVDTEDQTAALEYVTHLYLVKLPFIDRTRVGVFGEDYGGYITLMMLKSTEKLITCAAAQAPVIDWTMYASAFSERYLGSPSTEESRYQTSKVLPNMKGLQGGTLFLAHGTADANVHFQHSAELIKHLIKIGANYTMQIYPDEGHFLSRRSHIQLTHSLIGYFRGCLLDTSSLLDQERDDE